MFIDSVHYLCKYTDTSIFPWNSVTFSTSHLSHWLTKIPSTHCHYSYHTMLLHGRQWHAVVHPNHAYSQEEIQLPALCPRHKFSVSFIYNTITQLCYITQNCSRGWFYCVCRSLYLQPVKIQLQKTKEKMGWREVPTQI